MKKILLAGGLWLAPASALAQNTTEPATSNAPATDAIGPKELQNFSLPGTTTRPADQPSAAPATSTPAPRNEPSTAGNSAPAPARAVRGARQTAQVAAPAKPASQPLTQTQPVATDVTPPLPEAASAPAPVAQQSFSPVTEAQAAPPTETLASQHKLAFMPWIIAAIALASGTLFLLWRRRPRRAYAGPQFDLFETPETLPVPEPQSVPLPAPVPAPPKPRARAASGIVAARLRPSVEIGVRPLRCNLDNERVTIDFEIDLFNAGTAPARAVLAEASLFNAGAAQDQELAAFFANPVGAGQRIDAIPPMKRMTFTSQVVAPRGAIQEYELAGHKTFVPVIAFNALYEWSGGKGQTSAAYLVGRDTGSEKLGPLRADLGPREYRELGAHALPSALRI